MSILKPLLKNSVGDILSVWVEGNPNTQKTVILVHGYGTDKHEGGYFDSITTKLVIANFRIIRFDFSGYGNSEGSQVDVCYAKQADDLKVVIDFAKVNFTGDLFLIAQSMGTWVTALLSPEGLKKTIFTGIPNCDTNIMIDRFKNRFMARPGSEFNENGISIYPRSNGEIQSIGPRFWTGIRSFKPIPLVTAFSKKTVLTIIHWYEDEVIGVDNILEYDSIPNVKALWLHGNHSVSVLKQQESLSLLAIEYFNS